MSRELEILSMLEGVPNVIQLLDFYYSIDDQNRIIQNSVLEFCGKSLEDVIDEVTDKKEFLAMDQIKKWLKQMVTGLKGMHEKGIAHRDLKPENIMFKDDEIRITDVGAAKVLETSG